MKTTTFKLIAFDLPLYYAWQTAFEGVPNIDVIDGDILEHTADAFVSPANSFGYMDGGLDLKYSLHFGWELERNVREVLEADHFGEIPVGQAIIVPTNHEQTPWLISAPTMRVPSNVSETVNAYLAFKAIIQAVLAFNQSEHRINTVLCPGLGTGEGKMPAQQCAKQMREAYDVCLDGKMLRKGGLGSAVTQHIRLIE